MRLAPSPIHPSQRIRWHAFAATLALCLVGSAPASAEDTHLSPEDVAKVVRELETAIADARERLLLLVSTPRARGSMPLHDEPELRQIARELPQLEAELERWARLEAGPPARAEP